MPREDWINNPIHEILRKNGLFEFPDEDPKTVLDVACGLSMKSQYLPNAHIVGVELYEPYIKAIDYEGLYSIIKYDIRNLDKIVMENSFDFVYLLDIIEHLEKKESLKVIEICKRICKKALLIETPSGFIPQNIDIQGFGAHYLQTHKCGWEVDELEKLGFECIVRSYLMQDVKRHTNIDVDINIELIDGIFKK